MLEDKEETSDMASPEAEDASVSLPEAPIAAALSFEPIVVETTDFSPDAAIGETQPGEMAGAEPAPDDAEPAAPGEDGESEAGGGTEDDGDAAGADANLPSLPLVSVVEAVLFAAREPLKAAQLARAAGKGTRQDAIKAAIDELNVHYLDTGRAFEIAEISGRYQLMSRPEYVSHIMRIYPKREVSEQERSNRLTPSALETLSIIAYKQPVTRGEIEHIRGVGCGPVLRTLIERGSVKADKKLDLLGQPLVYSTTEAFLAEFGLGSLDELPLRSEFLSMVNDSLPGGPEGKENGA